MINMLQDEVSDSYMNEKLYKTFLKKFSDDPVPNIRFNYAKTAANLYNRMTNSNKMDCSMSLKKLSENDIDFDVKFFASKALSDIQKK